MAGLLAVTLPGYLVYAARRSNETRLKPFAGYAAFHGISLELTADLADATQKVGTPRGGEALSLWRRTIASADPKIRIEGYTAAAAGWKDKALRPEIHLLIERAASDPSPLVSDQYPLLLVLAAAPDAVTRVEQIARTAAPGRAGVAREALDWVRKRGGVGAG